MSVDGGGRRKLGKAHLDTTNSVSLPLLP